MKKILFTVASTLAVLAVSCTKSVEDTAKAEEVLPGTYSGYTVASCKYFTGTVTENEAVTVSREADGSFSVSYTSQTWGQFSVDNVTVSKSKGVFALGGNGTCTMAMNGSAKDYDITLEASVASAKTPVTFTFTVPEVMGGMTIEFHDGTYSASAE